MVTPLAAIADWPVDEVASAAALPDGGTWQEGPTERRFPLASVTKPLVAAAVLVAVEEGILDLDEPAGPPDATVRHLLAHVSGLGPDNDDVLAPPATRRIYSNRGFELLGELLAGRSGLPAADYLREAVLVPLGMTATALEGSPAHGAHGTVDDLLRFARELLAETPTILAPSTRDLMTAVAWPGLPGVLPGFGHQPRNDWGLGVEVRDGKSPHWMPDSASEVAFGHFGRSGSLLWADPAHRAALVVLGDRPFGEWAPPLWRSLGDSVLATNGDDFAGGRQQRSGGADGERAVHHQGPTP